MFFFFFLETKHARASNIFGPPLRFFLDPPLSRKYIFFHLKMKIEKNKINEKKIFWPSLRIVFWTSRWEKKNSWHSWWRHHGLFIVIRPPIVKEKFLTFQSHGFKYLILLDDSTTNCERKLLNILNILNILDDLSNSKNLFIVTFLLSRPRSVFL